MSQFTLSIKNAFNLPVKFTMKEGDVNKLYSFTFNDVERRTIDELENFTKDPDRSIKEYLEDVIGGWTGQRLVMQGDEPAEFSKEALSFMLSQAGVAMVIWSLYVKECGAKAKN